ncbi:MAG TPA: SLBB domain-containing protein [Gemmatimonadales bacterium]
MAGLLTRPLLAAALFCVAPLAAAGAQAIPSPSQAQDLLRANPQLIERLRQEISASGLSPEQVRDRLRAAGYPENLLDAYLSGGSMADSAPGDEVFSAVRELGIVDSSSTLLRDPVTGQPRGLGSVRRRATASDTLYDIRALRSREGRTEQQIIDERLALELRRDLVDRDTGFAPVDSPAVSISPVDARSRMLADSGYVIFGADVFRREGSLFDPNMAGPVDAGYRLGAGDRLVLILTGDVELSHSLDVTREGFVVIPQVGQIHVAGLTLGQLEDVLYERLGRAYSGISRSPAATTRFTVSVARLRSNQIFVTGDVSSPGSYRISSAGTALSALYAAGGPTANGSLRRIEVRRGGRSVATLDVYDYLLRGDASDDVRLENGDVVFVPVHGARVRVVGEVVRPATYEVKEGETLADVIRAAGGLMPGASLRRIQVERYLPPEARSGVGGRDRVLIDVAPGDLAAGLPAFPLEAGDVVRVFPVAERLRNRISVRGNVWAPGTLGLTPGMTVSEAIRAAGGLKPDAYLGQVLVTRLRDDSSRVQLRAQLADTTGAVVDDFLLREDDEIRVFSLTEFRPTRYVAITGAVRRGGQYPYRDGMTMRDLVLMAGGLREGAYLAEAEVARLPESRARGTTARTIRVPLDSSYIFERGHDGHYSGPPGLPAPMGEAPEVRLSPYDNVLILQQPDWELQRTVVLTGEVRFPGRYALTNKSERLADVIERAGGLTSEAYAEGVFFHRSRDQLGRIGIDLPRALREKSYRDNLLLADGDSINIPVYNAVVNVTGAVNSPVAVAYVPGRDLDYYINAAGGPSRNADMRRAFVTQPNGQVESAPGWLFADWRAPRPRPGSQVVVPERDPNARREFLASATTIVQILASLVTVVAVLSRN